MSSSTSTSSKSSKISSTHSTSHPAAHSASHAYSRSPLRRKLLLMTSMHSAQVTRGSLLMRKMLILVLISAAETFLHSTHSAHSSHVAHHLVLPLAHIHGPRRCDLASVKTVSLFLKVELKVIPFVTRAL